MAFKEPNMFPEFTYFLDADAAVCWHLDAIADRRSQAGRPPKDAMVRSIADCAIGRAVQIEMKRTLMSVSDPEAPTTVTGALLDPGRKSVYEIMARTGLSEDKVQSTLSPLIAVGLVAVQEDNDVTRYSLALDES